jgi:predicted DNA-binding transcriptional regulator YafY
VSQNERLQYIDSTIREKGVVTVQEVASKFEVSTRTVKRDIEYLRDNIGAPLQYIPHKKGYCYTVPFDYFTYRNERMLLFYVFLTRILESPTHFPFVDKTIVHTIRQAIRTTFLPLVSRITYEIEEWEELDIELFSKLFTAMRNQKAVTITYADANGRLTNRTIAPQHFIHYEGRWYCIAYDDSKKRIRNFLISRIKKAQINTATNGKQLAQEEIQQYINTNYGIYKGKTGIKVSIRFYEPVHNIVKNQKWHKDQIVREGKHSEYGAYIEMTLPVHHPQELLGKILRYGKYAEIISPQDIRTQWLSSIEDTYKRYCEKK